MIIERTDKEVIIRSLSITKLLQLLCDLVPLQLLSPTNSFATKIQRHAPPVLFLSDHYFS